ncbi:MAG: tetratricopeptide repeat protein [Ktedonobacterales bacterium]
MSIDQAAATPRDPARESTLRLGQRLRRARLNRNLTQGEVAKNQFSVSYVSAVERGQIRPSLGALEKLADRLQVPVTELLSEGEFEMRYAYPLVEHRESASERHRDEVESTLREAQILAREHKSDEAIGLLLRLNSQHLSPRETATLQWHLAYCYSEQGRAEEARRVAQDAIPVAEKAGERELAERLRSELGHAYSLMHSYATALDQYRECLRAVQENVIRDPAFKLSVLLNMGNQYWDMGEYEQAVSHLFQAAEVAEEVIQPETLGSLYWNISQALGSRGDHAGARSYALRSVAAFDEAENRRSVAAVYNRLGTAFARTGQVEQALSQLSRAYLIASGQQDLRGIAEAERNLALVYLDEERLDEANQAANEARLAAERLGDMTLQASSILVLARIQEALKQTGQAAASFERAIDLLQSTTSVEQLREAYAQFSEYLERHGESKRAFEMLKQAYKSTQRG